MGKREPRGKSLARIKGLKEYSADKIVDYLRGTDQTSYVLEGAVITKSLNLNEFRREINGAALSLEFRACYFEESVSLKAAHFARISFRGCAVREIDASDATIETSVDLSYLHSPEQTLGDSFKPALPPLSNSMNLYSKIRSEGGPQNDPARKDIASGYDRPYARLDWWKHSHPLEMSSNSGPAPKAFFGLCVVNLQSANIGGDLHVTGARLVGPSHHSTHKQLYLPPALDLTNAYIGSDVYFDPNRRLTRVTDFEESSDAITWPAAIIGQVKFRNTTIDGDFSADGLIVWGCHRPTLNGTGAVIRGCLSLKTSEFGQPFISRGRIDCKEAEIGRGVLMAGGWYLADKTGLSQQPSTEPADTLKADRPERRPPDAVALDFSKARIGGYFSIVRERESGMLPIVGGDVILHSAHVTGDVEFRDFRPESAPSDRDYAISFNAENAELGKDLVLTARIEGFCQFDGVRIKGSFRLFAGGKNVSFVYTELTKRVVTASKNNKARLPDELDGRSFGISLRRAVIGSVLFVREISPVDDVTNQAIAPWAQPSDRLFSARFLREAGRWIGRVRLAYSSLEARSRRGLKEALSGRENEDGTFHSWCFSAPWYGEHAYIHHVWVNTFETDRYRKQCDYYVRVLQIGPGKLPVVGRIINSPIGSPKSLILLDGDGEDIDEINRKLKPIFVHFDRIKPDFDPTPPRPLFAWFDTLRKRLFPRPPKPVADPFEELGDYLRFYMNANWDEDGRFDVGSWKPAKDLGIDSKKLKANRVFKMCEGSEVTDPDRPNHTCKRKDWTLYTTAHQPIGFVADCVIWHGGAPYIATIAITRLGEVCIIKSEDADQDMIGPRPTGAVHSAPRSAPVKSNEAATKAFKQGTTATLDQGSHAESDLLGAFERGNPGVDAPYALGEKIEFFPNKGDTIQLDKLSGQLRFVVGSKAGHYRVLHWNDLVEHHPFIAQARMTAKRASEISAMYGRRVISPRLIEYCRYLASAMGLNIKPARSRQHFPIIDLRGASVEVLDDRFGNGWRDYTSRSSEGEFSVCLRLDGFTYKNTVGLDGRISRPDVKAQETSHP